MNKQGLMNSIKRLANKRLPTSYSLCMIDLDDFKNINDQCGHLTGDKVLKIFAKIIRKNIDDSDLAGRFGGEEFIIIFLHDNSQKVLHTLQGIHGQLNQSFKHDIPFPVSFSAGIIFINDNESAKVLTDLLLMVDRYLYDAKSRGKGRAVSPLGEFIFNIEH
jgi:diguanylate cyclase (GGDEF)-like protein